MQRARPVATYAIGTLAAFWFVERVAGFGDGSCGPTDAHGSVLGGCLLA